MKRRGFFRAAAAAVLSVSLLCGAVQAGAIPPRYEAVRGYAEGLAAVCQGGRWGFADEAGRLVIPCRYAHAFSFSEGLAVVAETDRAGRYVWSAVDRTGAQRPLTYPAYAEGADGAAAETQVQAGIPRRDFDAAACAAVGYRNGYVNLSGCVDADRGMSLVFDRQGNWVELGGYGTAYGCEAGLFAAAVGGSGAGLYVDAAGTPALRFEDGQEHLVRPFCQGLAPHGVRDRETGETRWGFIDRSGAWVIPAQYTDYYVNRSDGGYQVFSQGVASVRDESGRWGGIDAAGRTVIPFRYERLGVLSEGLAPARLAGRYGAVDARGETVLPFEYDGLTGFSGGLAVASRAGRTFCIDRTGRELEGSDRADAAYYFPDGPAGARSVLPEGPLVVTRGSRRGFAQVAAPDRMPRPGETAAWAYDGVCAAVEAGLVPAALQNSYEAPMTRGELAALLLEAVCKATGRTAEELVQAETGQGLWEGAPCFADAASREVRAAGLLGLVRGKGGGRCDQDAPVTRQEAAVMLCRAGQYLGLRAEAPARAFADADRVQPYAAPSVAYVGALGLMQGDAAGGFAPQALCARQEGILAAWRLCRAMA